MTFFAKIWSWFKGLVKSLDADWDEEVAESSRNPKNGEDP